MSAKQPKGRQHRTGSYAPGVDDESHLTTDIGPLLLQQLRDLQKDVAVIKTEIVHIKEDQREIKENTNKIIVIETKVDTILNQQSIYHPKVDTLIGDGRNTQGLFSGVGKTISVLVLLVAAILGAAATAFLSKPAELSDLQKRHMEANIKYLESQAKINEQGAAKHQSR